MANNIYKFLMLILLLIVLPLGSYIYLKKGYAYRKTIMEDLSKPVDLKDTITLADDSPVKYKNKCTVVAINGMEEDTKSIYLQFKEAKGFQLVASSVPSEIKKIFTKSSVNNDLILASSYKLIDSTSMAHLRQTYANKSYIIIDSLSKVRYQYGESQEDKQKLVAHITALLPYYDEKKGK
jgi:hypothetical protein